VRTSSRGEHCSRATPPNCQSLDAAVYVGAQLAGAVLACGLHISCSSCLLAGVRDTRTGAGQWLSEVIATFGLLLTIIGCLARTPAAVPFAVGLYITSAYWFTASTSFANPAVTVARSISDTFGRYRAHRRHRLRLRTTPRHAAASYARALALAFLTGSSGVCDAGEVRPVGVSVDADRITDLAGIQIPSTHPAFLAVVGVHILLGWPVWSRA